MNWFKRLMGMEEAPAPPPVVPEAPKRESRSQKKKAKARTPLGAAKRFARAIPGASVEDFSKRARDDGMLARVTYIVPSGGEVRGLFYRDDDGDTAVWFEVRCAGVFGDFAILHGTPSEDDPDMVQRIYLAPERFVFGPRVRNEVARMQLLPARTRERLIALSDKVVVVKLAEEVMSLRIGDHDDFLEILEAPEKGPAHVAALVSELASIAREFAPVSKDVASLAEARTCRFCHASFVFSPAAPTCTQCGAPATTASLLPPPEHEEIPDDPIVDDEELDAKERAELMAKLETRALGLSSAVTQTGLRADPERARLFLEFTFEGRGYRAKLKEDTIGVSTLVPGVKGDFYLRWVAREGGGENDNANAWTESERRVFFSEHCRVSSDHTTREAARLASLPEDARALLLELCERNKNGAALEDERLAVRVEHPQSEDVRPRVIEACRVLARVAAAFPHDFEDPDAMRFRLKSCRHCGWSYYLQRGDSACSHCGAAAGPSIVPTVEASVTEAEDDDD